MSGTAHGAANTDIDIDHDSGVNGCLRDKVNVKVEASPLSRRQVLVVTVVRHTEWVEKLRLVETTSTLCCRPDCPWDKTRKNGGALLFQDDKSILVVQWTIKEGNGG